MKDTDVFTASGYDMVVAVTQKSINDQLSLLQDPDIGVLPTTLIMQLEFSDDGLSEKAQIYPSWDKVEKLNGLPLVQTINAEYDSSIQITDSGTTVNLLLTFKKGLFYTINMGNGHIMPGIDMTDWTWGISVNVDLAGMEREQIASHKGLSPSVKNTLENFTTDQFAVSNLFLDLQGTDMAQFNPGLTATANVKGTVHDLFCMFVANYLDTIKQDPENNPYILGYTVIPTTQTPSADEDAQVPDCLNPVGSTFTVFHDPTNPDRSTINFILNTKESAGNNGPGNHQTPGNFDTNWILPSDQVDGKMTYGTMNFLEEIILKPFYTNYAQQVTSQVGQLVSIGDDNTYEQAKQLGAVSMAAGATGFVFKIHDAPDGNNQYTNTLTANWGPGSAGAGVTINLGGNIHAYKYNSVNWGLTSAEASASMDYAWTSQININLAVDAKGIPQLTMNNPTVTITSSHNDHWENDFAKFVSVLGAMVGGFADMFTGFQDHMKATNWFLGWMMPNIDGIGGLNLTLGSVSNPAQKSVMLPAGDVFFFKDVGILPEGCLSFGLTYKTPTGAALPAAAPAIGANSATKSIATNTTTNGTKEVSPESAKPASTVLDSPISIPDKVAPGVTMPEVIRDPSPTQTSATKKEEKQATAPINDEQGPSLGKPMVDSFSVQQIISPPQSKPTMIDATVSCELMSNSKLGMPVSPSENMIVVQDNKGSPLIFTIGSDNRLYLLVGDSGRSSNGWLTINLLDGFTGYTTAVAFDAIQDNTGSISIAFALTKQTGNIDLFFASLLPNDLTVTDFGKMPTLAKLVQGVPATFVAESIRLGSSDDGKQPLLTVEGSSAAKHVLYQLDAISQTAQMLELPEDITPGSQNLLGHCQGFSFSQRANFFLYKVGDTKRLIARSNADATRGSVSFDYSPPALPSAFKTLDYNCIQTATSRTGTTHPSSDLYVGTSIGVFRIPNGKAAAAEQVAALKDVHGIIAAIDGTDVALWITSSPSLLYYVRGQRSSDTVITWNSPVLFASNVMNVAPMRNISKSSNELFVLDSDQTITHYWQDPTSTLWRSQVSSVQKSDFVVNFNSYTTHIHLQSNSIALSGQKILVTCSEWQYCTVNGLLYSLDADAPAEVTTDSMGNVTIISGAVDISPPVFHLQSPDFAETINIYPNGKILAHLQNITDGTALQNARAQDGSKVLPDSTSTDNSNGIAANIVNIHSATTKIFPPTSSGKIFTDVEHPASQSVSGPKQTLHQKLNVNHIPNGFVAGMIKVNGVWTPHTLNSATEHLAAFSVGSAIGDFFGDVWHDIEQVVDGGAIINAIKDTAVILSDGLSFIIQKAEDVLEFVLTIADKVVRIALDTLLAAFKALNFVLKLIGIDLTVILKWLGHLLGWDKIWDTHKLISSTITNFVNFGMGNLAEGVGELKSLIDSALSKVEGEIDNLILPDSAKNQSITNSSDVQTANNPQMQSPQANFGAYHLNNALQPSDPAPAPSGTLPPIAKVPNDDHNPLAQLINDVLVPLADTVMNKLGTDAGDLLKLIQSGSLDDLRILINDLIKTILDPLRTAIDALLTFLQDLIGDVEALLDGDLNIPIIGDLYEFVTALFGDEERFSIINGMSFIMAIPVVIMMEIADAGLPGDYNSMRFDTPEWLDLLKGVVNADVSSAKLLATNMKAGARHPPMFRNLATTAAPDADLKTFSAIAGIFSSCGALMMNPLDVAPAIPEALSAKLFLTVWNGIFSFPIPIGSVQWTYGYRVAMWGILSLTGVLCNFPQFAAKWLDIADGESEEVGRCKSVFKLGTRAAGALPCAFIVDFIEKRDGLTVASDVIGNFGALVTGVGGCLDDPEQQVIVKVAGITVAEAGALMAFGNSLKKLEAADAYIAIGPGGQ